jgi:hypothetical protein
MHSHGLLRALMVPGSLMMHRFRLLAFYVAGIVVVVGLTIAGVSMRRTADDHGPREASERKTVAPTTANAESICPALRRPARDVRSISILRNSGSES